MLTSEINHFDFHKSEVKDKIFNTQDMKFLSVVEDLKDLDNPLHSQNKNINVKWVGRISGYFCPETVFNLSHRVLNETEIKVLKKSLDYAPIRKETKQPKLRKDFSEFCRRIRNKW